MNLHKQSTAVLLLGSNSGDRFLHIDTAIKQIEKHAGNIVMESSLYETSPWGYTNQPDFINKVIVVKTIHTPVKLLELLKEIEKKSGRITTEKWRERVIDIDILFYNDEKIVLHKLVIPHPMLHERLFTLYPLNEIIPHYIHPVFQKKIIDLIAECADDGSVKKIQK